MVKTWIYSVQICTGGEDILALNLGKPTILAIFMVLRAL
jgi:hypothetical protein